jgi:hypothetical protein
MRKKAFRIQDLIAYLRRTEKENQDQKQVEEQEMLDRIRPIIQSKLSHLISDRINKMNDLVDKQNWKIMKLSQVLERYNFY